MSIAEQELGKTYIFAHAIQMAKNMLHSAVIAARETIISDTKHQSMLL